MISWVSRLSRSMRELSYFAWEDSCPVEPRVRESSLSCHVLSHMSEWTWEQSLLEFLHKKYVVKFLLLTFVNVCVQVLTKDSVTVSVDAVVYYRVSNATVSVANVENAHHSTRLSLICDMGHVGQVASSLSKILLKWSLYNIICIQLSLWSRIISMLELFVLL